MRTHDLSAWRYLVAARPLEPKRTAVDRAWAEATRQIGNRVPRRARVMRRAGRILRHTVTFESQTDDAIRSEVDRARRSIAARPDHHASIDEAYAVLVDVVRRHLGFRLHQNQIAAGLAMVDGCIVEMATGEGKTAAATVPAILGAWMNTACHVITANDYLAERDATWMHHIYEAAGLRCAFVIGGMDEAQRRNAYAADVTYVTHKEVAADYLRDSRRLMRAGLSPGRGMASLLASSLAGDQPVPPPILRGLHCAIVDEADAVLIDDAVTPLILSAMIPEDDALNDARHDARVLADEMHEGADYHLDHRYRDSRITHAGITRIRATAGNTLRAQPLHRQRELVSQALSAKHFFVEGREFIIHDGRVAIIDESTGRLMADRSWSAGLHQAIEVRAGVTPTNPTDTSARISFQRFFRLYDNLAGMTGTAAEARAELWHVYRRPTVILPTNASCKRRHQGVRLLRDSPSRDDAVVEHVRSTHAAGRPVLVGSRSVDASRRLSQLLHAAGLTHTVLNAEDDAREADIIAEAGHAGRITVATNMAGRGTDIRLDDAARAAGGLHVIASEPHESARVDRQLFGRAGRQGDPGSNILFAACTDDLLRRHAPRWLRACPPGIVRRLLPWVQRRAGRLAHRTRRRMASRETWVDESLGIGGRM